MTAEDNKLCAVGESLDPMHERLFGQASALSDRSLHSRLKLNQSGNEHNSSLHHDSGRREHCVATLIFDDVPLQREALAGAMERKGLGTPAQAWDRQSLSDAVRGATPDVLLLNAHLGVGAQIVRTIREVCPHAGIIVLGVHGRDEATVLAYAELGVTAFHMSTQTLGDLIETIEAVARGDAACPPEVTMILVRRLRGHAAVSGPSVNHLPDLTTREAEILELVATGLSIRDIGAQLCISLHTVKNHIHNLLGKLGVSSRAQAAALAHNYKRSPSTNR